MSPRSRRSRFPRRREPPGPSERGWRACPPASGQMSPLVPFCQICPWGTLLSGTWAVLPWPQAAAGETIRPIQSGEASPEPQSDVRSRTPSRPVRADAAAGSGDLERTGTVAKSQGDEGRGSQPRAGAPQEAPLCAAQGPGLLCWVQ